LLFSWSFVQWWCRSFLHSFSPSLLLSTCLLLLSYELVPNKYFRIFLPFVSPVHTLTPIPSIRHPVVVSRLSVFRFQSESILYTVSIGHMFFLKQRYSQGSSWSNFGFSSLFFFLYRLFPFLSVLPVFLVFLNNSSDTCRFRGNVFFRTRSFFPKPGIFCLFCLPWIRF